MRALAAFLPVFLIACSGSDFGVSEGAPEDATSDGTSDDTSTSSETSSDTAAETIEETCVKNACGGCTMLVGKPGDPCVSCGGKLVCKGTDSLECDSTAPKNACGGCSMLAVAPDTVCGVCMTGKYVCDGTDATKCSDPVSGPMPMSACGTCGTKKVICDPTAMGGTKCQGDDANACGGCGDLSPAPGGTCGVCGSGTYVCDPATKGTPTAKTKCDDPVAASSPKVGDACGTCKTLKYACSTDKKSVVCSATDDTNGCGGCGTLSPALGASCGVCAGGTYVCDPATKGTTAAKTKCNDPVTIALGTVCGVCSKSKYACSGGTTACALPDERTDGTDVLSTVGGNHFFSLTAGNMYGIAFKTPRIGAVTGFTFEIFRYDADLSAEQGTFRVRLIKGAPTTSPVLTDVVATFNIPPDSLYLTGTGGPHVISLTLPTPTAVLPAGTPMFVEFTYSSFKYNFELSGGTPPTTSLVDVLIGGAPGTTYVVDNAHDSPLKITMTGCY
ncbi:MAG: hypothetical protein ACXWUG_00750 [Polyangiales bacterium]